MPDKNIGSLPAAAALNDDSLLIAEQQGQAVHFPGKLLKDYTRQGIDALVAAALAAAEQAAQAANDAQAAADSVQDVVADTEAAKQAAQAAENAWAAAVQAAQYAEQVAALAAQQAAANVESRMQSYVDDAEQAKADAEAAAGKAATEAAQGVENKLAGYVSDAEKAKTDAENAAQNAVSEAETRLQDYVTDTEQAKTDAQNAAGTAAQDAVNAVGTEMAQYVADAQAAQRAAEQARNEAQSIAGGNFASTGYVDEKAETAESNANRYTDQKIAAIPTPDVGEQIGGHNADTSAHSDIRKAASDAASAAAAAQRAADSKEASGTAAAAVNAHNTATDAHNDIRLLITELTNRLNTLANSEDVDLDQMAELVAYIKDNRELIEQITTGKVSVSDIINNLTTNVSNKPLSAAQGVVLKSFIDGLSTGKLDVTAIANWAKASTKPTYNKSEVGLGNVANERQYSADNPPPYPVTSVNGQTGDVELAAGGGIPIVNITTTNGANFIGTLDGYTKYTDGDLLLVIPNANHSTGFALSYLDINGLGGKGIYAKFAAGAASTASIHSTVDSWAYAFSANVPALLMYSAEKDCWFALSATHVALAQLSGTFGGTIKAKADAQAPDTSLLRNTKLVTADTTPTNNGEIFWTYG